MKKDRATAAQLKEFVHRVLTASVEVLNAYEPGLWLRPETPAQRNVPEGASSTVLIQVRLMQAHETLAELSLTPVNHEIENIDRYVFPFTLDLLTQCFRYIQEENKRRRKHLVSLAVTTKSVAERRV